MERAEIDAALNRADEAVQEGRGTAGTGFWAAVAAVKRNPEWIPDYAGRIGDIDRRAFAFWPLLRVPLAAGTSLMVLGTLAGLGLVLAAYYTDEPWNGLLLLAGTVVTLVTTHGLAHLAVGSAQGMRFIAWFVGSLRRPQPGVKVDYATYLAVPARSRAWMHASGAITTKLIPFLALGPALVIPAPTWATIALVVLGIGQIATDLLWSTKSSDWAKFRREMGYATGRR